LGVAPCELDQRGRPRGVVVRARTEAGVVAMRHDDDGVRRASPGDRPEVLQANAAETGDALPPRVRADRQPVGSEPLTEPVRRAEVAGRPWLTGREPSGEVDRERMRRRT